MKKIAPASRRDAFARSNGSHAVTLRVANQGDAIDGPALNESLQLTTGTSTSRSSSDKTMALTPRRRRSDADEPDAGGASTCGRTVDSTTARRSIAEDVLFTFAAAGEGSDMKGYTNLIKEVRKLNDLTIEIETTAPYPILPDTPRRSA